MDLTRTVLALGLPYLMLLYNSTFLTKNVSDWLCLTVNNGSKPVNNGSTPQSRRVNGSISSPMANSTPGPHASTGDQRGALLQEGCTQGGQWGPSTRVGWDQYMRVWASIKGARASIMRPGVNNMLQNQYIQVLRYFGEKLILQEKRLSMTT